MLFFSELIGKHVQSEHQRDYGVLEDILFRNDETPVITKIIIRQHGHKTTIPITSLKKTDNRITVTRSQKPSASSVNELSIAKTLLDKQIIDLVGNKVVRANDVVIQDAPILSISGIDIGILGIFRRLGFESAVNKSTKFMQFTIPMQLLSWGDVLNLELEHGQIKIKQREEKLAKIHEEDLADYLEKTNTHNVHKFISTLHPQKAAEVIESLTVHYQVEVFLKFDIAKAAEMITLIDPDEAVDILLAIDRTRRDKIMKLLSETKQIELHKLMTFSRTPVGKLMTSEFFAVASNISAKDVLREIRSQTKNYSTLGAIYVLNRDDQLVGVFSPHELLMQSLETPVYKFMIPEPIVALLTTPIDVVIYKLLKYNISAIPVINRDKKVLGIVTLDDVSELLLKKLQ